jgi:flagellar biogenesis protein FliO
MSNPTPPSPPQSKFARLSPGLIGVGVLIIALGFGLPQLVPGGAPAPAPHDPNPAAVPATKPGGAVEPVEPPATISPPSAAGIWVSLLKLVVGLAVVCGLCVLLARWMGPKPPPAPAAMEVLASIAVGRCVVHLVKAGERRLLIGTDPAGVKALVELPGSEPALPPEPLPAPAPASVAAPDEPPPPTPEPLTQDEILNLLLRLRTRPSAPPPA